MEGSNILVEEFNAYFYISPDYDINVFRKEMEKHYNSHEKVRLIMDLEDREIGLDSFSDFKRLKKVFDEDDLGVEKLIETIVICKNGFKKRIIQRFIKLIPTKREVFFY
jgi:hypothetical protein